MTSNRLLSLRLIRIVTFLFWFPAIAATATSANGRRLADLAPSLISVPAIRKPLINEQTKPGQLAEKTISGGSSDTYDLDLLGGQYVHLSIYKKDLHILVTIYEAGHVKAAEFISRRYGPLRFSLIANQSGARRLEIHSFEKSPRQVSYRLELDALRNATARDKESQLAMQAYSEGEELRATWKKDSLRESIDRYAKASARWQAIGEWSEAIDALLHVGEVYFILSEYEPALKAYEEALRASLSNNDRRHQMLALNGMAYVHLSLSENQRSLETASQVLSYYAGLPPSQQDEKDHCIRAQALNIIGEIYYLKPDIQLALDYFNQSLTLSLTVGNRSGQALAHLNLGYTHLDSGNLQDAMKQFKQGLSLWNEIEDARGKALSNTAMGGIYSFLGEKQKALDAHENAMLLLDAIGDQQGEAAALNGIAKVYEDLSDFPKAFETYNRALQLYEQIHNQEFTALTKYYLGRVCREKGDKSQALAFYDESLTISRRVANLRIQAYSLRDIASINSAAGEPNKALDLYKETLALYEKMEDRRGQASACNNIGQVFYSLGNVPEAIYNFQKALDLSRAAEDRIAETLILFNLARAQGKQGDTNTALAYIRAAIANIESIRGHIISQDLRATYLASANQHYSLYIDLLYEAYKKQPRAGFEIAAFEASESYRARSLIEMLNESKIDIRKDVDLALLERERSLRQLLSVKAEYQMRLLDRTHTQDQAAKIKSEIETIISDYQKMESDVRAFSPHYAAVTQPMPLKLEAVQTEILDGRTVLLEYFLGTDRSFLWAVSQKTINLYELPGRTEIEGIARKVYQSLTARNQTVKDEDAQQRQQRLEQAAAQYDREIQSLSRILLGPVQPQLEGQRLLIVADGALQYVPFAALLVTNKRGGLIPLVVYHELISLPSASTLVTLRRDLSGRKPAPNLLAVLADPVFDQDDSRVKKGREGAFSGRRPPTTKGGDARRRDLRKTPEEKADQSAEGGWPRLLFTRMEADAIIKAARSGRIKEALGFEANKALATSAELSSFKIVHFATHGIINSVYPELSGIVLSLVDESGSPQDGFLRLHEIYSLKLTAELAVLSACQTGLGKEMHGEGLVGLTRGFMYAGVPRVVASLWNVKDEATAELMKRFYTAMFREGKTASAALQAAQASMWRDRDWQSSYYWAGFVIQGEWR